MGRIGFALAFCLLAGGAKAQCLTPAEAYVLDAGAEVDCETEPDACRWTFDLGAPVSRELFEVLRARLAECPNLRAASRDQGVNHPDFYDAWVFRFAREAFSLSIKDKSGLRRTFVVLRQVPGE
ncbi:MAG: hypothetical protein HKN18_00105 [Silicimonas sp.]|nr:hypothetical protein [Silicimonas sp.]